MLLDPTLLVAYLLIATAVALSPGPDALFVIANGLQHRRKGAIASAVGICCGTTVHTIAAALGVSAVIMASPLAFDLLRISGALYLLFLGARAIHNAIKYSGDIAQKSIAPIGPSGLNILYRGLLTNLLNPKVIIFYLALLPQFVNVQLGHVGLQIFLLGCIHSLIGLVYLVCIGLAAGSVSERLSTSGFKRWIDGVAGFFYVGLAVHLALSQKP